MIQETCAKLLQTMENDLQAITMQTQDPLDRLAASLSRVREGLTKLKATALAVQMDEALEIEIFKVIKPSFACYQIYHTELYTIETGMPFGDAVKQIDFLNGELDYGQRFFDRHQFLYSYYKFRMTEMDKVYFLRGVQCEDLLLQNGPERDKEFSTACDYLFAKFRAFEMLKEWIHEKLTYLKSGKTIFSLDVQDADELNWTGDMINAAELGYGLYVTGQLNHGQATIAQIFRWMEQKLKISIGIPAKKFAEIRARKRMSRTKFTDEIRDALLRKMDNDGNQEDRPTGRF